MLARKPAAAAARGARPSHRLALRCPKQRRSVIAHEAKQSVVTSKPWHQLPLKHVVDSQQFDVAALEAIFKEATLMEKVRPGSAESMMLQGYCISTLFYEPSTRTRLSFESAAGKLGGIILSTESAGEYSSAAKGETLEGARAVIVEGCLGAQCACKMHGILHGSSRLHGEMLTTQRRHPPCPLQTPFALWRGTRTAS
jgi:hypothetical protein